MTPLRLLHLFAALVVAVFVVGLWSTPGEAHGAHGAAPSRTEAPAAASAQGATNPSLSDVHASTHAHASPAASDGVTATASGDCGGHGGPGMASCCSTACHAVMAQEPPRLTVLSSAAVSTPAQVGPAAHDGPSTHIKRPPRMSAAPVG
ncbi:hypothetical protein ACFQ4O_07655 [Methylopila musalis]|uniref:CopL family metal-binding regulatory protein n=1 Tax=Methylopila musalis TaxID=1134781 RepID=A0ABW3Z6H3_9HYPH